MSKLKLSEVSKLITKGTTPTTVGGLFLESGINFVKSECIGQNKYLDDSIFQFIDIETDEKLQRSRLKEDDLLFSIATETTQVQLIIREYMYQKLNR